MTTKEIKLQFKREKDLDKKINLLGLLIDTAYYSQDVESIDYAINIADKFHNKNKSKFTSKQKVILDYFIGNAWFDGHHLLLQLSGTQDLTLYRLKYNIVDHNYHNEQALFAYRSALNEEGFEEVDSWRKCQILTNIGNLLSGTGRTIEAIEYWEKALEYEPKFTMAKGNKAYGIFKYGELLYDGGHQHAFLYKALSEFEELERDDKTANEAWEFFTKYKKHLLKFKPKLKNDIQWDSFSLGGNKEKAYRTWCLENKLFLNPLNDISIGNLAARDPLLLPSITTDIDTGVQYQGLTNMIKQEFVSARYLLYEGLTSDSVHFSDKEVTLYNTLDYASLSLNIEKVKLAYRACYSLIDKTSFFLIDYYNLEVDKNNQNNNLSSTLIQLESKGLMERNWLLKAIQWLDRDLSENRYQKYLDPDTRLLREIRNHLEHKYLKVSDMGMLEGKLGDKNGLADNLAYHIPRDKFEANALKLFKLVRSLILYLMLSIHMQENIKEENRDPDKLFAPMFLTTVEDDWKR